VRNKKLLILGIILTIVEAALIFNIFYPAMSAANQNRPHKKPVPSHGSVKGIDVGVYSDQACTTPVQSIQWGIIEPGATANQTVYVRNEGGSNTTLTMTTSNWNPNNASKYISLNWNYTGQILQASQAAQVKFTLLIMENVQGITDFSFDLTIASS
jgi:hypothetical protein